MKKVTQVLLPIAALLTISLTNTGTDTAHGFGKATKKSFTTIGPDQLAGATPEQEANCGYSLTTGDYNGDGYEDLAVGCPKKDGSKSDSGSVTVYIKKGSAKRSSSSGYKTAIELTAPSSKTDEQCGTSLATGDFNIDGYKDIIVGCPGYDDSSGSKGSGRAVVYLRDSTNSGFDSGITLENPSPSKNDNCGYSVAAGDFNTDAHDDAVIGCPYDSNTSSSSGSAVIFLRSGSGTSFKTGQILPAITASAYCGYSLTAADIDADRNDDLIVGCPGWSSNTGLAATYSYNRASSLLEQEILIPGSTTAAGCGTEVAALDLQDDRRLEIALGCKKAEEIEINGSDSAGSYSLQESLSYTETSGLSCDYRPSLAAGDFDTDSYDDLAVGCSTTASDTGNATIYFSSGSSGSLTSSSVRTPLSGSATELCGTAVVATDSDGDGDDTLALGCPGDDTDYTDAGNAVVFKR